MSRQLRYKVSSISDVLYSTRDQAFDAAVHACRTHGEPQVLMAVRPDGAVRAWEVISTEQLYFKFNQRKGPLVTLVDTELQN